MARTLKSELAAARRISRRTKSGQLQRGFVTVSIRDTASAATDALLYLTRNNRINYATAITMGEIAIRKLKAELTIWKRYSKSTGTLRESFTLQKESRDTVSIRSAVPYSTTWVHEGDQGTPDEKIKVWMKNKSIVDPAEFSDSGKSHIRKKGGKGRGHKAKKGAKPDPEALATSVAFLISRSIREGRDNHPTGKSALRNYSPTDPGSRAWNYPDLVMKEMKEEMELLRIEILDEIETWGG